MNFKIVGTVGILALSMNLGQAKQDSSRYDPTLKACELLATPVTDPISLQSRPAAEVNELDWKLSVCIGKYGPLKPTGVALVLAAHGAVADELRNRLEAAIKTLPPDDQAKVWGSFNSDREPQK